MEVEREDEGRSRTEQPWPEGSPRGLAARCPPPRPHPAAAPGPQSVSRPFSPPVPAPLGPNHFPAAAAAAPGLHLHRTRARARPAAATGCQGLRAPGGGGGSGVSKTAGGGGDAPHTDQAEVPPRSMTAGPSPGQPTEETGAGRWGPGTGIPAPSAGGGSDDSPTPVARTVTDGLWLTQWPRHPRDQGRAGAGHHVRR